GGGRARVRMPYELLGLPTEPVDHGPADPYDDADARSRAVTAARTSDAWLDGTVHRDDEGGTMHVSVRARDGRQLGRIDAHGRALHAAVIHAVPRLLETGALPRNVKLDAEFRTWSGVRDVEEALVVQAVEGADTKLPDAQCRALERVDPGARPPTLERG